MNLAKKIVLVATVGLAALSSGYAAAAGHVRFGVSVGVPFGPYPYYRPYYYPPYGYSYPYPYSYYPPAVVTVPVQPPTYVEAPQAAAPEDSAQNWWYYCGESKAYYPYVKDCPGGWQRVAPRPQS